MRGIRLEFKILYSTVEDDEVNDMTSSFARAFIILVTHDPSPPTHCLEAVQYLGVVPITTGDQIGAGDEVSCAGFFGAAFA